MSIKIEIYDGTTPMLNQIHLLSRETALEVLSVAGAKIQKEAKASMRAKRHHWEKFIRNGMVNIRINKKQARELGLRYSDKTGKLLPTPSMSDFIKSYLNEKSMMVVVGGKHKAFTPKKRRDGVVTGSLGRIGATGKQSFAILDKLNLGGTESELSSRSGYDRGDNWGGRSQIQYKGYNFMEEGYQRALPSVIDSMTRRYEALLGKAVNRATIKVKKVS